MNNPLMEADKSAGVNNTKKGIGDSLTRGTGGTDYLTLLGYQFKGIIENYGIGGQTQEQIAARFGGLPVYVTLTNNAFSGSGAITLTTISNQLLSTPADNTTRSISGRVCGQHCVITRSATGTSPSQTETYTIQPVGSNSTAIPAGSLFVPDDGLNAKNDILIFWLGRNNVGASTLSNLPGIIDNLIGTMAHPRRVLVIGVKNAQNETNGTANKAAIDAVNATLAANYPLNFILCTPPTQAEATAAGYGTFTTQDNTDIGNGIFPATFHFDNVHLNTYGYQVIANRVAAAINSFGW